MTRTGAGMGAVVGLAVALAAGAALVGGPGARDAAGARPAAGVVAAGEAESATAAAAADPAQAGGPTVERIAGSDRVATAAAAARRLADGGAAAAVMASAHGWADALAGAPLAVRRDAPVLLAGRRLPAASRTAVASLGVETATVLGGVGAVPLAAQLDTAAGDVGVDRIAGRSRTDTAALTARAAFDGAAPHAIVATSTAFPDALAAGALAAVADAPVLLTPPGRLDGDAEAAIADLDVESATVVGGTAAVGGDVVDDLPGATRLAGATRYATAARVAAAVIDRGGDPATVVVATGRDFPDALAGAVVAGHGGHPLVLVDGRDAGGAPAAWDFLARHAEAISRVVIMGGPAAVNDAVADRLAALGGDAAGAAPQTATAGARPATATAGAAEPGGDGDG